MARGNKRFEVVMSGMAWELRSGYVVKSNNITGGPIQLFSPPKMETFRGHARKFGVGLELSDNRIYVNRSHERRISAPCKNIFIDNRNGSVKSESFGKISVDRWL
ncbi:hypothetical protein L6452_02482 [Arctium lappa]|uniref:Uncharacterized protein n=1 Tax=Arctium lappa TaxID=4217 RepID=A0ACB9FKD2_ARCLA|nr:hypothetical protein L6452_02482 [Arctium lappa]